MPRYLIERRWGTIDAAGLQAAGRRSKQLATERFPEIAWEHSHVVVDRAGEIKSYCVYTAPSEDILRQHGAAMGEHIIDEIYEIGGDVRPSDFPG
jgi:uncharacterized protein DUF4242